MIDEITRDGFDCYSLYCAVKLHFTTDSYDFFKYKGKIKRLSKDSYLKRKDKYFFEKLGKKYSYDELPKFLFLNLSKNPKIWVGELCKQDAHDYYLKRSGEIDALQNNLRCYCQKQMESNNWPGCMECRPDYPQIIKDFIGEEVTPELLIVLDGLYGFMGRDRERFFGDPLWTEIDRRINKYKSMFNFKSMDKFQKIILDLKSR